MLKSSHPLHLIFAQNMHHHDTCFSWYIFANRIPTSFSIMQQVTMFLCIELFIFLLLTIHLRWYCWFTCLLFYFPAWRSKLRKILFTVLMKKVFFLPQKVELVCWRKFSESFDCFCVYFCSVGRLILLLFCSCSHSKEKVCIIKFDLLEITSKTSDYLIFRSKWLK